MEFVAWFGRILDGRCPGGREEMVRELMDAPHPPCPQPDLRALARSCGIVEDDSEYNSLLREVALRLVRSQLDALNTAEQDLLQGVGALDDLARAINLLEERLYEWSRLRSQRRAHGRELAVSLLDDPATGHLARTVLYLMDSRDAMEMRVETASRSLAPNLSMLAGPVLAARLIARAGGLRRLAELPASTLQVMGAERALFKHLRGHSPSPKHGIIYRHPSVMGAPRRLRGKAARALAGKLAIAARMDSCGAAPSPDLLASLEERLEYIRRRG
ncbi:MAG: ATP-binding protein [Methanothrix sp.]|nr:ATP-binding protein [Methanothrix sp.]